jgi:Ser/Thr protein kinase RdoA (MazF antagonist)
MTSSAKLHMPSIVHSIFSDKDLIAYLGAKYNFSIVDCQLVKPLVSTTYVISTSENKYILRIYPHDQSSSFISSEIDALLLLNQKGISVSVPQPNTDGNYLTPIMAPEGARLMALVSYAEGIPLARVENEKYFREFGRFVGSFHDLMDDQTVPLSRHTLDKTVLIEEPLAHISKFYSCYADELKFLNKTSDTIILKLEKLSRNQLHYGFCHGDLNSHNVHVSPKGTLTLFDFEYCGIGWQAYDLATFLNVESSVHAGLFMQGYQDVRSLKEDEMRFIPLFQIVQKIWMLGLGPSVMHTMGTFMFTERLFKNTLDNIRNYLAMLE